MNRLLSRFALATALSVMPFSETLAALSSTPKTGELPLFPLDNAKPHASSINPDFSDMLSPVILSDISGMPTIAIDIEYYMAGETEEDIQERAIQLRDELSTPFSDMMMKIDATLPQDPLLPFVQLVDGGLASAYNSVNAYEIGGQSFCITDVPNFMRDSFDSDAAINIVGLLLMCEGEYQDVVLKNEEAFQPQYYVDIFRESLGYVQQIDIENFIGSRVVSQMENGANYGSYMLITHYMTQAGYQSPGNYPATIQKFYDQVSDFRTVLLATPSEETVKFLTGSAKGQGIAAAYAQEMLRGMNLRFENVEGFDQDRLLSQMVLPSDRFEASRPSASLGEKLVLTR